MRRLRQLRTMEVALHKHGLGPVAGVDEAGRGACAGPMTIAACILPERIIPALEGLTDSKQLTEATRAKLFPLIQRHSLAWSLVHVPAREIDRFGVQHANVEGMRRAVARLDVQPRYVLTDALKVPGMPMPYLPVIGGDATARCIAAASVLAKHARDTLMSSLDAQYPEYGFALHKGYGTKAHMDAVRLNGATDEHRYSYANIARALELEGAR
ncbi:ribonuclease HII [Corynebacterium kozikiae]|uniref:ribonuclease HII n=1 Tax=Corynebacterium kozikiae TaxID=2968469 RepID=UPI00211C7399|nr:ribonuclease HII [Corynebacterium sp. 76QC2CO]